MLPHAVGLIVLNRARMRLLFGDADLRQVVDQDFCLDLEFPREFVDADLAGFWHRLSVVLRLQGLFVATALIILPAALLGRLFIRVFRCCGGRFGRSFRS